MKIAVIGAGIVGITTAYELACDGHNVTVFERNNAAAEGASFATLGVLASSLTLPLSMAAWPPGESFGLASAIQTLGANRTTAARDWRWLWQWVRLGKSPSALARASYAQKLLSYSQECLHQSTANTHVEYESGTGQLVLPRPKGGLDGFSPALELLKAAGISYQILDSAGVQKLEPALSPPASSEGGVFFPHDEIANCRQFALLIKSHATKLGVQFRFGEKIERIETQSGATLQFANAAPQTFEAVAVCGGAQAHELLSPLKVRLPMATVLGHTLSTAVREVAHAPRHVVMDAQTQITLARIGNRIRVSGGSALGGATKARDAKTTQSLYKSIHDLYPGCAHFPTGAQVWQGARTMTHDGLPFVGASSTPHVWLNLGHGANGWGMAHGTARLLADLIQGRSPALDTAPLSPLRAS